MTSMTRRPDLAAALCEVCCRARTVKYSRHGSFYPRGYDHKNGTCDLKCAACGRITRHALVLPERAEPPVTADPFDLLRSLGIRVHRVDGLREESVYCPETDVAFVRTGLAADSAVRVADWVLCEALSDLAAQAEEGR